MKRLFLLISVAGLAAVLFGCIGPGQGWVKTYQTSEPFYQTQKVPVIEANYDAADEIASRLKEKIPGYSPIYAGPFINMEDTGDPSAFGKVVGEQVADRLTHHGWMIRTGQAPIAAPPPPAEGEPAPVPVRLSGTYVVSEDTVFVSARIVKASDNTVIEGQDWNIPVASDLGSLLNPNDQGGLTPSVHTQYVPAEPQPRQRQGGRAEYMHPAGASQPAEVNEMNILTP